MEPRLFWDIANFTAEEKKDTANPYSESFSSEVTWIGSTLICLARANHVDKNEWARGI